MATGKRLKFGGEPGGEGKPGLVKGQHTYYETLDKDAVIESDVLVRGNVSVVRAEPGHEVDADQVLRVHKLADGKVHVDKIAQEYVDRGQASYVAGAAAKTTTSPAP